LSDRELRIKGAFDLFMLSAGLEYGDVYSLPYSGGTLNQPYKTARMWVMFKNELVEHIGKENKKRAQAMKRRK